METNRQLDLAFNFVQYTGQHLFLSGKAGTGKTTFLKSLKEKSPKRMIVVAPTGVAAINAGGVTIHSFFQLSFGPQIGLENASEQQNRYSKEKINIIRSLDLLVIDEISMVRADLLDAVDRVLRRFRDRNKTFGGVQLLMIGDLQQLSPIVKNDEWSLLRKEYDTVYFFSSKALCQTAYVSIELLHVFRQQDDRFISILNKVRENKLDQYSLDALNQRHIPNFKHTDDQGFITLCTHNIQAHRINDTKLEQLPSKTKTFKATIEGNFPEYSFPTDFELKLKVNAQVMFVKNDPDAQKLFYNGKIGRITKIEEELIYVLCPDEEDEIAVNRLQWDNIKYSVDADTAEIKETAEGSFRQFPLKLAWAITIHKSQGLTFERAIIDAEASFAHGQVYVALSRCKTMEGMVLSTPISNRSIINDETVSGFIQKVEQNQPDEQNLLAAKLAYQRELLMDLFRFDRIKMLTNSINKQMRENSSGFPQLLIDHFKQIQFDFQNELMTVSEKFQLQIEKHLATQGDVAENAALQERISNAANYFHAKLKTILIDQVEKADLEIDNAALRKQINATAKNLLEETALKLICLDVCKTGFQVKKILDTRAKAMMEKDLPTSKKRKAKEVSLPDSIPHPELYSLLRAWRYEKSVELRIPVYLIFSQKALIELVNYLPTDKISLTFINGLGSKKIDLFGVDIIQMIQHYCNENTIEKGEIPFKKASEKKPKPDTKKLSFELFQSGKTVDEIAEERGFAETTIESHLAYYIGLGAIDAKRFLSEAKLQKIVGYFKSVEDKSLGIAKAHFGDEFTYSELRVGLFYFGFLEKEEGF
jgi:hypothetical protein